MTEPASSGAATPIVVAINAARRCAKTLELATALASSVGADLEVVFVEDANLLRLADVPVTCEIDRVTGMSRQLDSRRMLRALRCEVQLVRRELTRLGKGTSVRTTVTVVRGHYLTEALAAAARGDVTFVHGARRPLPGDNGPATPMRPMAPGTANPRTRRFDMRNPLWTLFDGSPASARALKVALVLSRNSPGNLVVLVPDRGTGELQSRKREAQIASGRTDLQFLAVPENWFSPLGRALAPGAGSLLVVARNSPVLEGSDARNYLESLSVPVVLVT